MVSVGRIVVRGKRSGADVTLPLSQLFGLRQGLIVSVHAYGTRDEALEAAGLRD